MYPIMLHLTGKRCLVVGAGGVALRKIQGLVGDGARVQVVAPEVVPELETLAEDGQITLERRVYRAGEAADYVLVFTATDRREVNRQVFEDASRAGVWVNSADDPENCSFHLPARVQRSPLQIAIASAGQIPFAVRRLRQLLEHRFGPEWSEWVEAASRFRSRVLGMDLDPVEREACFERFFDATVDRERLSARVPTESEQAGWTRARTGGEDMSRRPRASVRPPAGRSAPEDALLPSPWSGPGRGAPGS